MKNNAIEKALKVLAAKHDGQLKPEHVVEAARPVESVLHDRFEWNDGDAAEKWRLHQARTLINVCVEVLGDGLPKTPVFVSLSIDRQNKRGYRLMTTVMSDVEARDQLLADALAELDSFQRKYSELKELSVVFEAARKVPRKAA